MRYLISETNANDLLARKQYIFETMNLWTSVKECTNSFIELTSVPSNCLDILFIVGHNNTVYNYIKRNNSLIKEKTIIAITCDGGMNFSELKTPGKNLFISHQNIDNYAELFDGSQYHFEFNPTESELLFYNSKSISDLSVRLKCSFTQLH